MDAGEIMTRGVITVKRDESVLAAMEKMVKRRVTSLIVEKTEKDKIYGIVTRRDVVNKVIACGKDPAKLKVAEVMSEPLMTISPEMGVEAIARLMAKTNIRRFPVMDGDAFLGIVSNSDILRAIALENM